MAHNAVPIEFHIDPHTGAKSITGRASDANSAIHTIKLADVYAFSESNANHQGGSSNQPVPGEGTFFWFSGPGTNSTMIANAEDAEKIRGFFRGLVVEVDANGMQINPDPIEGVSETEAIEASLAEVKRGQNNLALSVAALIRSREEEVSRIYGGFRLEIVAKTETTPMYADLFGLEVIDPNPANEATDTIVCAINMVGANMCQHKMFPDLPDDNQWVITIQTADGKSHRFHTHSSGDFGLIFDAIRAGATTKVYSTRPATPQQPAPSSET